MENEKKKEWIVRFQEGRLRGKDLETFLRMMEEDPQLRQEVAVEDQIQKAISERDLLEFRKVMLEARKRSPGTWGRWLLLAALLLVLMWIGGYFLYMNVLRVGSSTAPGPVAEKPGIRSLADEDTARENRVDTLVKNGPVTELKKAELLAVRYEPFPPLESLVGVMTRAGNVKMLHPVSVTGVTAGKTVRFIWESDPGTVAEVILLDNRGNTVLRSGNLVEQTFTLSTDSLPAGLYYWKMLGNSRLVTAGKIKVEPGR